MGTLEDVVREAHSDALLRSRVLVRDRRRVPLMCEGEVAGFVTPHETKSGWRAGPIFVLPQYRNRGLVRAFYAEHPDRTWVAFVPTGRGASLALHKRCGFVHWKNGAHGEWLRRKAT